MLAVFGLRDMKWKTDESPCVTAECVSLCRSPGHRMILISSRLFLSACACIHVCAVHNIRRHRSGRCTVTCSLTGTLTQLFPYFPHRCLKLTLTYAIPCLLLFPNMNLIIFLKPPKEKQAATRFFFWSLVRMVVFLFLGRDSYPTVPDVQITSETGNILDFIH